MAISEGPTVRYFTNHFVDSVLFLFSYEKPAKHVTYPRVILGNSQFASQKTSDSTVPGFALYIL